MIRSDNHRIAVAFILGPFLGLIAACVVWLFDEEHCALDFHGPLSFPVSAFLFVLFHILPAYFGAIFFGIPVLVYPQRKGAQNVIVYGVCGVASGVLTSVMWNLSNSAFPSFESWSLFPVKNFYAAVCGFTGFSAYWAIVIRKSAA